ncbi:hypothetical protein B7P43_G15577 [Cryptotermes secundus]|uniref:Neurogenic mastermind-like N-terminal domain-containing protein n=1 Tax=Cryptotermes secundus TaxID=105785 RepID=A0A2J7PFM8_9NEOP|nr:hypothetical protein B7P43_G15577 [Cryptotermes secundus]
MAAVTSRQSFDEIDNCRILLLGGHLSRKSFCRIVTTTDRSRGCVEIAPFKSKVGFDPLQTPCVGCRRSPQCLQHQSCLIISKSLNLQQQKFLKRTAEELDPPGGSADAFEPPAKIQCTGPGGQQQENLTNAGGTANSAGGGACVDIGNLVECKQEPDSEFVDLEQCAAALEKDAAANGASFPGFSDLIGDDTSDEIITSDAFKDLISEISDFHPEFMRDFDFEDKTVDGLTNVNSASGMCSGGQLKAEDDNKDLHLMDVVVKHSSSSPLMGGNSQYSPQPVYDPQSLSKARMAPYPPGLAELSPAAQTLKQMAEQHQHKTQLGMSFNPAGSARNEVVFSAAQMNGRQTMQQPQSKQTGSAGNPMMGTGYPNPPKQQYSPYGSPGSLPNHGSPQYLPRGQAPQGTPQHVGQFSSSTPPRPPSCPGTASLQINQAQQMHINQQGQQIQVTALEFHCEHHDSLTFRWLRYLPLSLLPFVRGNYNCILLPLEYVAAHPFLVFSSGVILSPFGTVATTRLPYQPQMIADGICDRGNRSTRRKPAPVPLCPSQIPRDPTWARARAAPVGNRRLTASIVARPQPIGTPC